MNAFVAVGGAMAIAVAAGLGARMLLRRWLSPDIVAGGEKILPFLVATIGLVYGMFTSLTLSGAVTQLRSLQATNATEIGALADIGHLAWTMSPQLGQRASREISDYVTAVIERELQADRGAVSDASPELGRLWQEITSYQASSSQAALRDMALMKTMIVGDQRRIRLAVDREPLPRLIWFVLLFGGVVIASGACLASLRYGGQAALFLSALVAMLALVLTVIYVLEQPSRFGVGQRREWYERVVTEMNPNSGVQPAPNPD
jgi:Protein of unknown function (DUF4239)